MNGQQPQTAGRTTCAVMTHMSVPQTVARSIRGLFGDPLGPATGQLLGRLLPAARGSPQNHHMRKVGRRTAPGYSHVCE